MAPSSPATTDGSQIESGPSSGRDTPQSSTKSPSRPANSSSPSKTTPATSSPAANSCHQSATTGAPEEQVVVQYVVVRTDLDWSTGAMIAQACHASIAAIARTLGQPATDRYLADLENMHKVVLRADKLDDLRRAETKLKAANVPHHVWIEQPENIATCLAIAPQPKELVRSIFKHLKLLR